MSIKRNEHMEYRDRLKSVVNLITSSGFDSDMEFNTLDEEIENNEVDYLEFSTREHGSVYDEEVGQGDIDKLKKLLGELKENDHFIDLELKAEYEFVDEWVMVTITNVSPENYNK